MAYTRRSFLYSATALSLAAVGHDAFTFSTAPEKKMAASPPQNFNLGVRIFFAGSWLFCSDGSGGMLAIAIDMPSLPHLFPYGAWDAAWVDASKPSLPTNLISAPYAVGVTGTTKPATDVNTLFTNTLPVGPFNYLPNPNLGQQLSVDGSRSGLRVVSMPIPTSIIPAAFRSGGSVSDPKHHFQQGSGTGQTGYPTTHIFVYDGATQLTFPSVNGSPAQSISAAADSSADFHFHTVPSFDPGFDHGPCMFENLMSLIVNLDRTQLALLSNPNDTVDRGSNVPTCVSQWELEIMMINRTHTVASCAGSAAGLGAIGS